MSSLIDNVTLLQRNNISCDNSLERKNVVSLDEEEKFNWYENPLLQPNDASEKIATNNSSLCASLYNGLLMIVILPVILILFILFLLLWILPGFGLLYERYAEARDRKKYYPSIEEMQPWGCNNTLVHVVHLRATESKLPPIVYISGLGTSMYVVKSLFIKFVEYMREPVEILSFDSPGYGASEPPTDWNTHNAETELALLRQVIEKSALRKPFILFGASAGASLAQLYRLTYPDDVAGTILFDPTPSNIFEPDSPMVTDFNRAFSLYSKMACLASWGVMRPLGPFIRYFVRGEFGDIFRHLPKGHVALFMTKTMLLKTGHHFRYWHFIMDCVTKLQNDIVNPRNSPLLVVSALNWTKKRPHGGLTREEMRQWWRNNQQPFVRSSNNAGFVSRTDYTHTQCMLDMQLATNATKAILTQIPTKTLE
ncbi:unnamed protein product [Rotaria socialis]|uniref:AB hydrolase-1 domain-containing protein n=1 Tax=Rotaria socialis TaxID=392032 RepID=A0A818EKT3_9BILA|nr:unnamed protein product [Rotaria socialis]CAF4456952.1 unnamed protein product [Rotaria socialis]